MPRSWLFFALVEQQMEFYPGAVIRKPTEVARREAKKKAETLKVEVQPSPATHSILTVLKAGETS